GQKSARLQRRKRMTAASNTEQIIGFSYDAIRWLFTWSWQALLVLGIAWVSLNLDRSRNATNRFRVWLVAAVIVSLLPILNLFFSSLPAPVVPVTQPVGIS